MRAPATLLALLALALAQVPSLACRTGCHDSVTSVLLGGRHQAHDSRDTRHAGCRCPHHEEEHGAGGEPCEGDHALLPGADLLRAESVPGLEAPARAALPPQAGPASATPVGQDAPASEDPAPSGRDVVPRSVRLLI